MIRFLLNDELVELGDVEPDLTVLDWLRIHRHLTGTKEGCASGDCGACTVVVATPSGDEGDTLHHETINSCITFIGSLHGKQLLTVESLSTGNSLHPVQQAMVEAHGSQCGFCTPGFVMSMFALYQQDEPADVLERRVDQALGGNLCRCTGYRPIRQAARQALQARSGLSGTNVQEDESRRTEAALSEQAAICRQLREISGSAADIKGFHQPMSLESLARLVEDHPDARLLAGGTDLALEVTQQMKILPHIISLKAVPELKAMDISETELTLGATVSLTQCLAVLGEFIPGARELLLRFGSDQVRNQATVGGNIGSASPIGDLPPVLIALDTVLVVQKGGRVRELPLADHYLGYRQTTLQPGEFIRAVRIPLPRSTSVFAVHKVSKRRDDDISTVCLAIHLPVVDGKVQDARLAFGGMAATPLRAKAGEAALTGRCFDEAAVADAQLALSSELNPMSDARASAAYRLQVAQNLLWRVWQETL